MTPNHRLGRLGLLAASTTLALVILESAVRIVYPPPVAGWYGYPQDLIVPDRLTGYKYQANFSGTFPNPPFNHIRIVTNADGLRDVAHAHAKVPGVTRILGLGDSVTFGAGVSFEDTYLAQLEGRLRAAGKNVEIIKAGVNSYEFDQESSYYRADGRRYQADIVLIGFVLNDTVALTPEMLAGLYATRQNEIAATSRATDPSTIQQAGWSCRSCVLLREAVLSRRRSEQRKARNLKYFAGLEKVWQKEWPGFAQRFSAFVADLKREGVTPVLIVFPLTEQFSHSYNLTRAPQEQMRSLASQLGVAFLDLLPSLDRPDWSQFYLAGDDMHLNGAGYGIVADTLGRELLRLGIL
jgi:lysophospholipase L1-like esterase